MSETAQTDMIVVGAGAAGLTAALGLAQAGWAVTLVGRADLSATARTVALFDGSLKLLQNIGVLDRLRPDFAALETMRIVDDTGSLFRTPPVDFRASEIGLDVFGENIENRHLVRHLADAVRAEPRIKWVEAQVTDAATDETHGHVTLDTGATLSAKLLVSAEGRKSLLRQIAKIETRNWSYPQVALTALLTHDHPHREISTEFHTRQGPFTLVPLPASADAPNRSSVVWMMDPTEARRRERLDNEKLAIEMTRQSHHMLGKLRMEGPRGAFPMSGLIAQTFAQNRIALVGDAAHGFPPIGAQGLNLGMRDIAHLIDALYLGEDCGAQNALARYDAARRTDVRSRVAGVDVLNRSLLAGVLPVDFLRGAGLLALSSIRPLKRMVMREGVMPRGSIPRLMQSQNNL
jgi:2-octaprenyl-6-methoxyphenol hydroxylase